MRKEIISWNDVDQLIDHLIPQFHTEFDALLGLTKGGIVPAGILSEALNLNYILLVSVEIPEEFKMDQQILDPRLIAWPRINHFPEDEKLKGKKVLIVTNAWGTGRMISSVKNRVSGAGGTPFTAVLHYNPGRNLFKDEKPDFFAAVTDAWIIYPWESARGVDPVLSDIK